MEKFDFSYPYSLYPKKGEGKTKGMKTLEKVIRTEEDFLSFCQAVKNYAEICKSECRERQFIKQWSTFCNNWQDYLDEPEDEGHLILQRIWNENCGDLPKCLLTNSERKQNAQSRWFEWPDESLWTGVADRIAKSSFCSGKNDHGWKADFDFFIKPETHVKVLEGKYDNQKTKNNLAIKESQ